MKMLASGIFLFFIDYVIGNVLKTFYFKQESGLQYRTTYSIDKTTADVLIFGSSTANHNYEPNAFEKGLGMSFYNAGADGSSIFYDYGILRAVLKRYKPKIAILSFEASEFFEYQNSYDELSALLPYYEDHPEIDSIVRLKSRYERLKLFSHIYPYNSSIFTIAAGNADFNKKKNGDIKGYVPLTNLWDEPIRDGSTFLNRGLDCNKIKIYRSFIEDCLTAKVKLYVICPPLFIKPNYKTNSVVQGKKIATALDVSFIDFSKDSFLLAHPELFADISHLNDQGAKWFSEKVVNRISSGYEKTY